MKKILLLAALPAVRYELAEWKQVADQRESSRTLVVREAELSHICQWNAILNFIRIHRKKVDVRITGTVIEVFYNQNRIAFHRRLYGCKNQYSTVTEHMPKDHQHYLEWNGDRFRNWAERIGENTAKIIDVVLRSKREEQQSYRACMGLLKLADKYSPAKPEEACKAALSYTPSPSYKSINNMLAALKR